MSPMSSDEYEQLVASIVGGICKGAGDLNALSLGSGRSNRITGASGYDHQIDVSLQDDKRLFIVECKCWSDPIGVQEILVLAARAIDIAALLKGSIVSKIIVSTQPATAGAQKLAGHFGVALEVARSSADFGLRIGRHVAVGVVDRATFSDRCEATVIRNGVEVPP